jgi:hypothetical protein
MQIFRGSGVIFGVGDGNGNGSDLLCFTDRDDGLVFFLDLGGLLLVLDLDLGDGLLVLGRLRRLGLLLGRCLLDLRRWLVQGGINPTPWAIYARSDVAWKDDGVSRCPRRRL